MIGIKDFDNLISDRRKDSMKFKQTKCRVFGECSGKSEQPLNTPLPVYADNHETSKFIPLAVKSYERPSFLRNYTRQMRDLTNQLAEVQSQMMDYGADIGAGSTSGLGLYMSQGETLAQALIYHHERARLKSEVHKHHNLEDMRFLYGHVIMAYDTKGLSHPQGHPIDYKNAQSRVSLIEDLTEDYEIEPMSLFEMYTDLSATSP